MLKQVPHLLGSPGAVLWIKEPHIPCTVALLTVPNEAGRQSHLGTAHLGAVSKQRQLPSLSIIKPNIDCKPLHTLNFFCRHCGEGIILADRYTNYYLLHIEGRPIFINKT